MSKVKNPSNWTEQDAVEFAENLLDFQFEYPMITFLLSSKGKAGNYKMLDCLNGGYTNSDTHEYPTNLLAFINSLDEQILITITEFMEEQLRITFMDILNELSTH